MYLVLLAACVWGGWLLCSAAACRASVFYYFFCGGVWFTGGLFDSCSVSVLLMLLVCFGFVSGYTIHYLGWGWSAVDLKYLICLFVGVMSSLIFTFDFLASLVFWEFLGVVSFFLILFYLNYSGLRSSVVTLVSSRFGDVSLFFIIGGAFYFYSVGYMWCVFMLMVICTKSASFPFVSWLLEAMRAPTPVSSLVHSSTLVAAGVWFSLRYDLAGLVGNNPSLFSVMVFSVLVTGVASFFFFDLKKIVALSTCNNINWCIIYLCLGGVYLSLFQLVCHGVSKCLLFMMVGDVMSGSGGSQAGNFCYSSSSYGRYGAFGLVSLVLGLSGAPFIGVFFTKHVMLAGLFGVYSPLLLVSLFGGVFLSYFYSYRLCRVLISSRSSGSVGVLFVCSSCSVVYWWMFLNYFVAGCLDECYSLGLGATAGISVFQALACWLCWVAYDSVVLGGLASSLFGVDNLVELVYLCSNLLMERTSVCVLRWDSYVVSNIIPTVTPQLSLSVITAIIIGFCGILTCLLFY
uniref:NADH:ubiquinone reductase (H(+)-translocating) n=1 Tax=Breviscolex orientalis TaxID=137570 RepID=A0A343ESR4_9CEST|nr:NADH dehydrogenase subunit 5 [Breviscolex orientalis]ASL24600.1 NADH dehydrogenase subunit 5 [Breviscolex orientalis]